MPILGIQTRCTKSGMIATYQGKSARSMLSVEALRRADEDAIATAAGLARRAGASAQATTATPEDEAQIAACKENIIARLLELQWCYSALFHACHDG